MEKNFKILTWFKSLSEGWRAVTILFGAVITIAGIAIAIDHFKSNVTIDHSILKYLMKSDSTNKDFREEIRTKFVDISDTIRMISKNQRKQIDSYATFVQDNTNSVKEFMNYMNGMEFTIVAPVNKSNDESKADIKIKIQKRKK
jgi:hypothetical protein